jgi:hypothetical protein
VRLPSIAHCAAFVLHGCVGHGGCPCWLRRGIVQALSRQRGADERGDSARAGSVKGERNARRCQRIAATAATNGACSTLQRRSAPLVGDGISKAVGQPRDQSTNCKARGQARRLNPGGLDEKWVLAVAPDHEIGEGLER